MPADLITLSPNDKVSISKPEAVASMTSSYLSASNGENPTMLSRVDSLRRSGVWSQKPMRENLVLKATLPSLTGISPNSALQSVDFPDATGPTTTVSDDFGITILISRKQTYRLPSRNFRQ
jgi:hypothetical protein